MIWVVGVFGTAVLSLALALRSGWAWKLAVDLPNNRSLHSRPTPRVGGVLVIPWVLFGCAAITGAWGLISLAGLLYAVSFLDDRFGLPVALRFGTHLLLAFALSWGLELDSLWVTILAAVLIAWMVNLYNFMDGADGLAGGMALFGFGTYATVAWMAGDEVLAFMALSVTAGALAFLAFNFPPAKIFLGDAGSTTLGFLASFVGLLGWRSGLWPYWLPILVFSPFICDATVTLIQRVFRGERFWQAHRDHYYQRLIRMGWSHRRTTITEYGLMLAASLSAIFVNQLSVLMQHVYLLGWMVLLCVLMFAIDRAWYAMQRGANECD